MIINKSKRWKSNFHFYIIILELAKIIRNNIINHLIYTWISKNIKRTIYITHDSFLASYNFLYVKLALIVDFVEE